MVERIYIVGAGAIAGFHVEALERYYENKERPIVKITDINKEAIKAFITRYNWVVPVEDLANMLAEEAKENDIVIVATPPFTHLNISCQVLESGRHVLCEKPLVMNDHEATILLNTAQRTGKTIGCCSTRFTGMKITQEIKHSIDSGDIGDIYLVKWIQRRNRARSGIEYQPQSNWFLKPNVSGGGTLMDWGPYDISGLIEILNPKKVEVLHAWSTTPRTAHALDTDDNAAVEQHIAANFRFTLINDREIIVNYERAACCHGDERSFNQIEGSRGAVIWDWPCFSNEGKLTTCFDKNGEATQVTQVVVNEGLNMMDKPISYFIDYVSGHESVAIVNEQAVFNFKVLHAVYKYIESGKVQMVCKY